MVGKLLPSSSRACAESVASKPLQNVDPLGPDVLVDSAAVVRDRQQHPEGAGGLQLGLALLDLLRVVEHVGAGSAAELEGELLVLGRGRGLFRRGVEQVGMGGLVVPGHHLPEPRRPVGLA